MSQISKIVITGAGGLLGRHLVKEYKTGGQEILAFRHEDLDVTDNRAVARLLDEEKPKVMINAAALCSFNRCEEDPELSARVNADAPIQLAALTAERGIRLVHFSTDYIFDGKSTKPYREGDIPHPLSVYGHHKAAVEAAFQAYPGHLLLRVAWLFGREGPTFLSMLPHLLQKENTVHVAAGKLGTCLHVGYAATIIRRMIEQGSRGLFNLVHSGEMSWEGYAAECLQQLQSRGLQPACQNLIPVPLEEMPVLRGERPVYSPLDLQKLTAELGFPPIDWREGLAGYLDDIYGEGDSYSKRKTGPQPAMMPT